MQGLLGFECPCVSHVGINQENLMSGGYYVIYQYDSNFIEKDNINGYRG